MGVVRFRAPLATVAAAALLSAVAGAYALIRGRGGTVVGVAIAIALMPPLVVVGFGIATLNWTVFTGALLLRRRTRDARGFQTQRRGLVITKNRVHLRVQAGGGGQGVASRACCRRRTADMPVVKVFLDVLQRATLRRKLEVLAGYDTSQTGAVIA